MARTEGYTDALLRLVKALNKTRIRYALTGAAAVGYYGIPRASMDIDVVLTGNLSETQFESLTKALLERGFSIDRGEIQGAILGHEVKIQAFDDKTGFLRVDMFLEQSFSRVADRIDGLKVWFRTFEDLVAKKIQYGDLDEAELLLRRRTRKIRKEKIVRFLNDRQKEDLEKLIRRAKTSR